MSKPDKNSRAVERMRQIRKERRERGLCPYCGKATIPGKSVCGRHAAIQKQADMMYRGKSGKVAPPMIAEEYVETPENRWVTTFSIDCPTVWTIAGEQR